MLKIAFWDGVLPKVGSSKRTILGSMISARQSGPFLMPPDNSMGICTSLR